jgi:hypothetical protein
MVVPVIALWLVFSIEAMPIALAETKPRAADPAKQGEAAKTDMENAKRATESSRNALGHGPKLKESPGRGDKPRKGFENLSASEAEALARELQQSSGRKESR